MPNSVQFNEALPNISKSLEMYQRGLQVQSPITQTLAKGPGQFSKGVAPVYLQKGKGARVWDVDGNEYIDFNMGIGPLSLGYCIPEIDDAIQAQLKDGITFSLMHPLEVELAEILNGIIPNAEVVKYSKTGADVTSAAVRIARAYTGRDKVFCCGYHGWHDWYIGITSRSGGIPEGIKNLSFTFPFNDIESIKNALDETVACVILEPFIFEKDVFSYTTFGGEALSLAACKATIEYMQKHDVIAALNSKGEWIQNEYNKLVSYLGMSEITSCVGYPCRSMLTYQAEGQNPLALKTFMQQELLQKGILWGGFHNISYSHSKEDLEYTIKAYAEILPRLKLAIENNQVESLLKGELLEAVFRKINEHNIQPKNA